MRTYCINSFLLSRGFAWTFILVSLLAGDFSFGKTIVIPTGTYLPGVTLADSLSSREFVHLYGKPDNFLFRAGVEKTATVAFLGGSITAGGGWREKVMQYLQAEFPDTEFAFLNAGIPSLGSLPHAFRLQTDVLANGRIDLLFVESAVNDLANGTPLAIQKRALEGIVRHARKLQPAMDIVLMAFADEIKIADYSSGKVPAEVSVHEQVARHYRLPFINLANEVYRRIHAKEFSWKEDFVDLHPSPFGHQLYFRTIRTMFELAREGKSPKGTRSKALPAPLDKFNYESGQYIPVDRVATMNGFRINSSWKPTDQAKTRKRFTEIPMLVSEQPGDSFEFTFTGNTVGIAVVAGPDAGIIRYSVDGGHEETMDLFTQWSRSLHLPWFLVMGDGLKNGEHTLRVTLLDTHNQRSTGSACRVFYFLVN